MEIIQVFSYLNGMCSALHFTVCLLCGLQLCFGLLHTRKPSNVLISRYVGIIFLMMSFTTMCYILSALSVWSEPLFVIGSTIMYLLMSIIILYVFVKIINFGSPVSLETLNQVEQNNCSNEVSHEAATPLQAAFLKLLDEKQVFLKPDLTVEDVVKDLGTNTKYFSRMLHNEMHTSFCGIINSYRVERAKELLKSTDGKIEVIAGSCGFNSHYSFIRTFSRITGKTPNEWRNS